jgi:predicted Zn-dependent peptidase
MKAAPIVALAVLTWASTGASQQPDQSTKGAVVRGRAPVSEEVLRVKLPRAEEADLSNGVHLMVLEDHRAPTISFQLIIQGAGGYYDQQDLPGLADFTAALMREGTKSRTSQQISEQLDTLAATVGIGTSMGSQVATMSGSSLTENFDQLLTLATDILLNPTFPEEELARFKTRQRAGLIQQRSNPGFLAREMMARVLYGTHPASRVSTTIPALERLSTADLAGFHRRTYVPDYAVIGVSGDITMSDARKKFETALGGWRKSGAARPTVNDPADVSGSKVYLVNRTGSVQTSLVIGTPGISRLSPDYDVLAVMNHIVGGGPTGRLFLNLREDKGYTYGASSGLSALRYRGSWQATTDVRSEVTGPALTELMGEIRRLRDERVPDREFRDAKRALVASFALDLESPGGILGDHLTRWLYNLPVDYWDQYPDRIMAVTQEQVQAAARKYLDGSRLQIVAVGDGAKVADVLKAFGAVETYDTEGKKIGD